MECFYYIKFYILSAKGLSHIIKIILRFLEKTFEIEQCTDNFTQNLVGVHVTTAALLPRPRLTVPAVEVLVLLDVVRLEPDTEEVEPELAPVTLDPVNLSQANVSLNHLRQDQNRNTI